MPLTVSPPSLTPALPSTPSPEAILGGLDPQQRQVAQALTGPVCVMAGAGTGKTRAITARLAYGVLTGVLDPHQVLALTFTTKAADEMRARLHALAVGQVTTRTFHSAALRQLQYFWPRCIGGPMPQVVAAKASLVARAASKQKLPTDKTAVRDLAAEIEWAKVRLLTPQQYPQAARGAARAPVAGASGEAMVALMQTYEQLKRETNVIDFEDVLVLMVGLLGQRPEVAARVRARYRHFVVDEYQDVSPVQQQLLTLWLGGRDSVCVVGDAAQTIYSFAGAQADSLAQFRQQFPHATVVRLVRNYRSCPAIVGLANAVLSRMDSEISQPGSPPVPPMQLQPHQHQVHPGVAALPGFDKPGFVEYPDELAEAEGVAQQIAQLVAGGVRPREVAILVRVNASTQAFEQALAQVGLPCVVRGGQRFFDRPQVREAVVMLKSAAKIGGAGDYVADLPHLVSATLRPVGLSENPPSGLNARERWESLRAVVEVSAELASTHPGIGLTGLVTELERRAAASHEPVVEGVTIASLHAAKGLEWPVVFLPGLVEGNLPIAYASTAEQIEEERRLFYVGLTRARQWVGLSWARARTPAKQGQQPGWRPGRRRSRFVLGVAPRQVQGQWGTGEDTIPTRAKKTEQRQRLLVACRTCHQPLSTAAQRKIGRCDTCPATYDQALYERLRAWRLQRSTADSVPAFVVFTDATLIAIAEAVPTTDQALLAIPGVGKVKLDRYGAAVLELCAP